MRKLKPTKKQLLEREEKMIILRESWKNGNYERLNKIEFNYLKKVITEYLKDNGKSAYSSGHEMGFNNSSCNIMFEKFYQFHLIDYVEGTGWFVPKEIGLLFESLPEENSVKSIFGSPKAEELYRILKKEGIAFAAQIKTQYGESPLFVLLYKILEKFLTAKYIGSDLDGLHLILNNFLQIILMAMALILKSS